MVSNIGARVDLTLRQGTDFVSTLTFLNLDGPLDFTGATLAAQIRSMPTQALLATFSVAVTDATAGVASLELPAAASAAIPPAFDSDDDAAGYWWDLKLTDSLGAVSCPLYGRVFVMPEITQ